MRSAKPLWGTSIPAARAKPSLCQLLGKLFFLRAYATARLLRHSRVARWRAILCAAGVLLLLATVYVGMRLPSGSRGAARAGGSGRSAHDALRRLGGRTRLSLPDEVEAEQAAGTVLAQSRASQRVSTGATHGSADVDADAMRKPGNKEEGYAESLRRRAAELNLEISRIKGRSTPQSKQERLQMAARVLSTQLAALKEHAHTLGQGVEEVTGEVGNVRGAAGSAGSGRVGAEKGTGSSLDDSALPALALADAKAVTGTLCGSHFHPEFRVAMILPWVDSSSTEPSHPPAWFPHLVATAAHSSLLVDWIVLHEGSLSLPPDIRAPNVRLVDLKTGGIARLLAARLAAALGLDTADAHALDERMGLMFGKWPRLVAEYKPAYGEVFERWLGNYTHWGYTDFDTILGQLPRFIERSELTQHHIVTYSFGDEDAVYLRGQWTIHRKDPAVNRLWRRCSHLSEGLLQELALKIAHMRKAEAVGKTSYHKRFLSAEGCYSYKAAHTKGLKIKVATKQFVGMGNQGGHVYALKGSIWRCERDLELPEIAELVKAIKPMCSDELHGVQTPIGEPQRVSISNTGCGGWMPPEYRMCAHSLKGSQNHALYLDDGVVYSQRVDSDTSVVSLGGICHEGAFFHMQEWKKRWAHDGASNVDPRARFDAFRISERGIHAIPGLERRL